MKAPSTVYLLVGQRGAGKSTYANKLLIAQPELILISRDELLMEEFGCIDKGNLEWGRIKTLDLVAQALKQGEQKKIILDYWTSYSRHRKVLVDELRKLGANQVIALYFRTTIECVSEWFWQKPLVAKINEMRAIGSDKGYTFFTQDAPLQDHGTFHRYTANIREDGFDTVIEVDPLADLINL